MIKTLKPLGLVAIAFLVGNLSFMEVATAGEEREPPPARRSDVLSERTYRAIQDIQELMSPEDENDEPDLVRAKEELDELYERYDRMNDFEKSTILNFYTNYYLTTDNIPEAINTFEQILTIEDLREDTRLRSLRALGQLYMSEERFRESIDNYDLWRELSAEEDDTVFLGLANSHYSLEEYAQAVPYLLNHMEMLAAEGRDIERNKWGLLNVLYIEQEDYVNALEITKNMIVRYNEAADWRNLSAIYSFLEQDANRIGALNLRFLMDIMESDTEYLNLAQSLAGEDLPYTGARIVEAGIEAGMIEEDEDNLFILIQMYQLASEYEAAVEPAIKYAEIKPDGDGYDALGYIYYVIREYEQAAQAFSDAIDKGSLSNPADTNLFLARAPVELDEYDEALVAARRSADLGDEGERRAADSYINFINDQKARYDAIEARKAEVLDFYVSYEPLQ